MTKSQFLCASAVSLYLVLATSTAHGFFGPSAIESLIQGRPVSEAEADQAMQGPKNATYVAMLEAFNLLRRGDLDSENTRSLIVKYLTAAESSFADLRQPDNFSVAFSADADTPYRGRPHERVLTAVMLAIMDMSRGRYDMALPALKNAEFLDARWQAMPYGTDAPLVYALTLRCLSMMGASPQDSDRARQGLHRSVRLLILQEPIVAAANSVAEASVRNNAVATEIAHLLMGAGLSSALMIASDSASIFDIIKTAAKEAASYVSVLEEKFPNEYESAVKPALTNVASVTGMTKKDFEKFSFALVGSELDAYAKEIIKVLQARPARETALVSLRSKAKQITREIEKAMLAPRTILRFEGIGPRVERFGQYNEVAQIVKSPTGSVVSEIRSRTMTSSGKCGLSNVGGFLTVVLCDSAGSDHEIERFTGLELWSSSRKATSVMGRRFATILKGRAQFRASTESIAVAGAIATAALLDQGQHAAAGVAAGLSLAVWLIGRASNPEADPRFIPYLFESGYVLVAPR